MRKPAGTKLNAAAGVKNCSACLNIKNPFAAKANLISFGALARASKAEEVPQACRVRVKELMEVAHSMLATKERSTAGSFSVLFRENRMQVMHKTMIDMPMPFND